MTQKPLAFLTLKEVVKRTSLSAPTIRRLIKAGEFPQPFDLSAQRIAFWEHEIEAWLLERAARGRKPRDMPVGGRKRAKVIVNTEVPENFVDKLREVVENDRQE